MKTARFTKALTIALNPEAYEQIKQITDIKPFESIPGVRNFAFQHDATTGTTDLTFILADEAIVADIVAEVPKCGSKIISVEKTEPTLEDVFVALVGRGLHGDE